MVQYNFGYFADRVLSQWPFNRIAECLKSLANHSNAWGPSVWTHEHMFNIRLSAVYVNPFNG